MYHVIFSHRIIYFLDIHFLKRNFVPWFKKNDLYFRKDLYFNLRRVNNKKKT